LELVRNELKSVTTSISLEIKSLRLEINSKFEKLESNLFAMKALLEEQNSRNRVVLDEYAHLFDKSLVTNSPTIT
jgi:hypothetical protein